MSEGHFSRIRLRVSGLSPMDELDVVDDLMVSLRATGKTMSTLITAVMPRVEGYVKADGHQDRRSGNWFLLTFAAGSGRIAVAVPQDLARDVSPIVFRRSGTVTNLEAVEVITRIIAAL